MWTLSDWKRLQKIEPPTYKNFVVTIGFLLFAISLVLRSWQAGCITMLFTVLAVFCPKVIHTSNLLWHRFGLLLAWSIQPMVLIFIYFLAVTPTSMLRKVFPRPRGDGAWVKKEKQCKFEKAF